MHLTKTSGAIVCRAEGQDAKRRIPASQPRSKSANRAVSARDNRSINWFAKGSFPIFFLGSTCKARRNPHPGIG
jgi:hypothetical protein